ncbi:hypothetical protein D9M72_626980 [compost metagenome]
MAQGVGRTGFPLGGAGAVYRVSSGRDHADGAPCSANVLRPSGSPLISLRKAPHQRDRHSQCALIGEHQPRVLVHRALGAPRSEIKEEGRSPGGHSRRGVPGVLGTYPESTQGRTILQSVPCASSFPV